MKLPRKPKAPRKESFKNGLKMGTKGTYIYRISVRGRIRTGDTSETTLGKASNELIKLRAEFLAEEQGRKKPPSFKQAVAIWASSMKGKVSERYIKNTSSNLLNNCPELQERKINTITLEDFEKCMSAYLEKVNSGQKVRIYGGHNALIAQLRSLFNKMIEYKYIQAITLPKRRTQQERKYDVLNQDELDTLIIETERRYGITKAVGIAMGGYLGLRISEITNATWSMINWKDGSFSNDQTKGHEVASIPIAAPLLVWLKKLQTTGSALKTGYILLNNDNQKVSDKFLEAALRRLGKELFNKHISNHSLRRTFITILHNNEVPLGTLQQLSRHKKLSTLMRYVQVEGKQKKLAIDETFNKSISI